MSNSTIAPSIRLDIGGLLIIHKNSSECAHCGTNVVITNYPCQTCGTSFNSAALSYIEPNPDEQIANLIADGWNYLRFIGWAAGGMGNWRVSANPYAVSII